MKRTNSHRYKVLIISLITILLGCNIVKEKVDTIIIGAKIYTTDSSMTIAQAMAINDGKIIAIGSIEVIEGKYQAIETHRYDSSYIFPGFIDAHCHFLGYGLSEARYANLTGTHSFEQVIEKTQLFAKSHPENPWILGRGWDQNDWDKKEFPTKEMLDKIWPDKPVLLVRVDGHAVISNSMALKLAGFDENTRIKGGNILVNDGELTGVLLDNAADSIKNLVPDPSDFELIEALKLAQKNCFEVGLTSVVDAGLNTRELKLINVAQDSNILKMNIYAMLSPTNSNIQTFVKNGIYKTDHLHIRSIKLYADGALGSRGACLLEPYSDDPENHGLIITEEQEMLKWCQIALDAGYQINTHAIGDSAVRLVLKTYGKILKGKNDKRWRIEHSQVINPADFHYFSQYNIIPAVNTTHATSDMYWATQRIGNERIKGAYAYKSLLDLNQWITNGSDFPIESINPLYGFYAAIERRDLDGFPKDGFFINQAITREEALKAMTIWAAKGSFEENEKGSLEAGKQADFVILDRNIMEIKPIEIPTTKVISTWSRGEKVY